MEKPGKGKDRGKGGRGETGCYIAGDGRTTSDDTSFYRGPWAARKRARKGREKSLWPIIIIIMETP